MARNKKTHRNKSLPKWASANQDCLENRFVQCGNSLYLSKTFQSLKYSTQRLYENMMLECGGCPDFCFPASTAKKYGMNNKTVLAGIEELISKGFIEKTECGRWTRTKNKYRFVSKWKTPPVFKKYRPPD